MNIWKLFSRKSSTARPFEEVIAALDGWAGLRGSSGVSVSTQRAIQVSTVLACVKSISDGCAVPELIVRRLKPDGTRELATDTPQWRLLNRRPNEWQTSMEWRRTMTLHAALTGNAVSVKVRDGRGRVVELIPVAPEHVVIEENARYDIRYRLYDKFGLIGDFGPEDVFHLPSWQWDRVAGMNAVALAREAIGLSIAAEESQGALHRNGGRPSGVFKTAGELSDSAIERLKADWSSFSQTDRHGAMVLDSGLTFEAMAMTGVESQHLETRRLQIEEICRAFNVFPPIVGHSDKASTFASAEAFFAAHHRLTLRPWHMLWRQRIDEFLLDGPGPLSADFDTRYLLTGSTSDRAQYVRTMSETGTMTRNELRDEVGLDPLEGLDEPLTPLNMQTQTQGATN